MRGTSRSAIPTFQLGHPNFSSPVLSKDWRKIPAWPKDLQGKPCSGSCNLTSRSPWSKKAETSDLEGCDLGLPREASSDSSGFNAEGPGFRFARPHVNLRRGARQRDLPAAFCRKMLPSSRQGSKRAEAAWASWRLPPDHQPFGVSTANERAHWVKHRYLGGSICLSHAHMNHCKINNLSKAEATCLKSKPKSNTSQGIRQGELSPGEYVGNRLTCGKGNNPHAQQHGETHGIWQEKQSPKAIQTHDKCNKQLPHARRHGKMVPDVLHAPRLYGLNKAWKTKSLQTTSRMLSPTVSLGAWTRRRCETNTSNWEKWLQNHARCWFAHPYPALSLAKRISWIM